MKVLLVDDDPTFLELSKTFLEMFHDINSDTVDSAGEAINKLQKDAYDVIVSDYDMPAMDGITFLKSLREKSINTPFILFTGIGNEEVMHRAIENGASSYLQKGGDPKNQYSELSRQIEQIARNRAASF
jgi:DNA-binding NtrC family response regulator